MNKKTKILLSTLGVGASIGVIAPIVTSCSTSNSNLDMKVETFSAIQSKNTRDVLTGEITYVADPNLNSQAQAKAQQIFNKITYQQLQKDFDFSITRLFDAYEYEQETSVVEVESDIRSIKVLEVSPTPTGIEAIVEVTYKVETEADNEHNDYKRDSDEKVTYVKQCRKIQLDKIFCSEQEIQSMKSLFDGEIDLPGFQNNLDLEELGEFYFGEKDDDDLDDIGIFDLLRKFKRDHSDLGSMLGYNVDLLSLTPIITNGVIKSIPKEKAVGKDPSVTKTVKFFAPSFSNSYFFYANDIFNKMPVNAENKKLNLIVDLAETLKIDNSQFVNNVASQGMVYLKDFYIPNPSTNFIEYEQ